MAYTINANSVVSSMNNQPPVQLEGVSAFQSARNMQNTPSSQGHVQPDLISVVFKDGNTIVKFRDSSGKVVMQVPTEEYLILRKMTEDREKQLSIRAT